VSIIFSPDGSLNLSTDPSDLPESGDGVNITSGAMTRCKNLRINQKGKAVTRDGSFKLNETAIATAIWWIEEQAGTRYTFAGTAIYEDESSIETGLTSAQWSAIKYNAFNDTTQQVFALNGTDRKRIAGSTVAEWGIAAPEDAPTLDVGAGSGLTGEYNAKYTYVRKVGSTVVAESDPSPAGTSVVLANQSLGVTVTQPTDSQVTHIRLYRTTAGGTTYLYDQEVPVNTTYAYAYAHDWEEEGGYISGTGYQFTTADETHESENTFSWEERFEELGTTITVSTYTVPFDSFDSFLADGSLSDQVETDHDRPPLGSLVFGPAYDGTCFILYNNLLHYCKPKQPEYWPATYFIEVGPPQFPLISGCFHNGQPYVASKTELWYIQGTGHGTFFPLPLRARTGAQSIRGMLSVDGKGIYHTGPDGIYLFASGTDLKITEDALEPIFRGETVNEVPGVADMSTAFLWTHGNHLYFGYAGADDDYPTNVLVVNLDTNRLSYHAYPFEIRAVQTDVTNKRFLIGDNTGFVRAIEASARTDDSGTDIEWQVQSKDYMLSTRKHFPRWCKYDVDASSATSVTGALILDGSVHHSHTITGSRNIRRRLVDEGNGSRAAIRISGSGPVSIFAAEAE
jgi:hypothetical protein